MPKPCTCIVGVGPGLGAALARRFVDGGHVVALLSRSAGHRDAIIARVAEHGGDARGFECDATDPASVRTAFARVREALGDPEVLIYNAGTFAVGGLLELDPERFDNAWRVNCFGGFLCAREVAAGMQTNGHGTLLFTGATASLRGGARFAGLAVGKFGLRALAQSLARELGPQGIHVGHVVVDGQIGSDSAHARAPTRGGETFLDPAAIAETYWQLYTQPRSAWTLELDLRPHVEHF